ncbi:5bf5b73f-ec42-4397-9baa-c1f5a9fccee0 [Thermothielavioides terrestris]|uniref:5bf5b73f-ec42-4397-9baa-c1f5a9fccee0 n=1 Tax=Thermothielavioides terrestris TaxID=2587410 RepID=A0A446BSN8_9PEZI|nr:5bf5b73f-ec42-4397-9baa-c1f5a9fccee0 [Thermothielavioides terrestris]
MTTNRISERLIRLCTSSESVSSLLAKQPSMAPSEAWERLYGEHALKAADGSGQDGSESVTQDELEKAAMCGKWGPTKPGELFLKIYHDALCTLDADPLRGMVSPSLMGSCGTVPLTIISVLPDIVRHMANVIVRAEREVLLATNYWQNSVASKYITNAIRELDRRAGARGAKIVLKIIYDRGSPRQLYEPHYIVAEKEFTSDKVNLPHPSEIPNIDMQVMNFHTPLMGTFHAKYMVVDRKIALLQSNNIQDNDNLEMLIHLEGPIVDSLYDMALISWYKHLDPPLPSHNSPAAKGGLGTWPSNAANGTAVKSSSEGEGCEPATIDLSVPAESDTAKRADVLTGPSTTESEPSQNGANGEEHDGSHKHTQDLVVQASTGNAMSQTSEDVSTALPPLTADNSHYDDDIAGEVARIQASLAPKPGETHLQAVTRLLNHTVNEGLPRDPNAPECPPGELMTPYIPHQAHTPYPMALVNRAPYGPPTHNSVSTPQNAAWLSALRNAKESVYIVSPTLNAAPLIPAIKEACERGVDVYCYICISYNDAGELLPRQGGHNERVSAQLHGALDPAARRRLHWHWYVGKDQTRPVTQARRQRSSHVKLMVVDGRVGIQGNGNQDTQSWFHSQEVNLLVDSAELCAAWLAALRRNQNTERFGAVDTRDGVWRDAHGREVEGAMGVDPGWFPWLKGVKGQSRGLGAPGGSR